MQEFCQQQLCWSRAVANAALSITDTAHVLLFQLQRDVALLGVISSKAEPHIRARRHPECQTQDFPLNSLSRKKGHTKAGGDAKQVCLGIWVSTGCLEGAEASYLWSLWSALPHRQKFTPDFWLDDPSKAPASCTEWNFKLLKLCLQFWDRLGRARKFIAFSRDILCEYRASEFHKGCFSEVEAPSIL